MKTENGTRLAEGADTAILFIHGILGTPDQFTPFLPLVPPGWSVRNLLLKGHGGRVQDLSAASMAEWKAQVHCALQSLRASHRQVLIAAHSMGTLFAIQEAAECPVAALFLLNTPLRVRITPRLLITVWRVFRGSVRPDDAWTLAAQRAYGMERDGNLLHYLGWLPRYRELFAEIRRTRRAARRLTTASQVYLSLRDEMVSPRAGRALEGNAHAEVKLLPGSGHFYYAPEDWRLLEKDFCGMVRRALESTT